MRFPVAMVLVVLSLFRYSAANETPSTTKPAQQAEAAGKRWVFLNDGRVAQAVNDAEPWKILRPDGTAEELAKESVLLVRTDAEVTAAVDAAMAELVAKPGLGAPPKKLVELKAAAVPRLLHHLGMKDPKSRLAALRGLRACWSGQAREPVVRCLIDEDPAVRNVAADVIRRLVSRNQVCERLSGLLAEKNFDLAVPVFELAEERGPDAERMKQVLSIPAFHQVMDRYLSRYYLAELTPGTLKLLESKEMAARRVAIIGLIQQNDDSAATRGRIARVLTTSPDEEVREAAGEYLLWHGAPSELAAVERAAAAEKDPYVLASIRAASEGIVRRDKGRQAAAAATVPAVEREGAKALPVPKDYRDAHLLVRIQAFGDTRAVAWRFFRTKDPFEPTLLYAGQEPNADVQRRASYRLLLAAELFAFPGQTDLTEDDVRGRAQPAGTFMPPVRDYLDPGRQSFGAQTGPGQTTFSDSVHVGDDVAWIKDQRTVVCIGDGVVRRVRYTWTWGHVVIVEHELAGGEPCCSLYAHLSPAITVKPGEMVKKGQRLGSVGRSHTWENGGYWAHLHFGIHQGPYDGGNWICGYVGRDDWKAGRHGWLDPQKVIKERLEKPATRPDSTSADQGPQWADRRRCRAMGVELLGHGPDRRVRRERRPRLRLRRCERGLRRPPDAFSPSRAVH